MGLWYHNSLVVIRKLDDNMALVPLPGQDVCKEGGRVADQMKAYLQLIGCKDIFAGFVSANLFAEFHISTMASIVKAN